MTPDSTPAQPVTWREQIVRLVAPYALTVRAAKQIADKLLVAFPALAAQPVTPLKIEHLESDDLWARAEARLAASVHAGKHRITRPIRDAIMAELYGVEGVLTEARDSIEPKWRERTTHDAGSFYCVVGGPGHVGECSGYWPGHDQSRGR